MVRLARFVQPGSRKKGETGDKRPFLPKQERYYLEILCTHCCCQVPIEVGQLTGYRGDGRLFFSISAEFGSLAFEKTEQSLLKLPYVWTHDKLFLAPWSEGERGTDVMTERR
jgi:hypothetical protein